MPRKTEKTLPQDIPTDALHLLFYFLTNAFEQYGLSREGIVYIPVDGYHVPTLFEVGEDAILSMRGLQGRRREARLYQGDFVAIVRPGSGSKEKRAVEYLKTLEARKAELDAEFDRVRQDIAQRLKKGRGRRKV